MRKFKFLKSLAVPAAVAIVFAFTTFLYGCKIEFPEPIESGAQTSAESPVLQSEPESSETSIPESTGGDNLPADVSSTDGGSVSGNSKPSMSSAQSSKADAVVNSTPSSAPAASNTPVANTVSLTMSCTAILNNMTSMKAEKRTLVPANGILYQNSQIPYTEGMTVKDLVVAQSKKVRVVTVITEKGYIQSIGGIAEFDCGGSSGWLYAVNGKQPGYGCQNYKLKAGDSVIIAYTCNGGTDLGFERLT